VTKLEAQNFVHKLYKKRLNLMMAVKEAWLE